MKTVYCLIVGLLITVGCSKDVLNNRQDVLVIEFVYSGSKQLSSDMYKVSADVHLSRYEFTFKDTTLTLDDKHFKLGGDTIVNVSISIRQNLSLEGQKMMNDLAYSHKLNFLNY
jgi:hypothetical protein